MAGLLSAQPILYDEGGTSITIDPASVCGVALVGAVEAANNVLVYAVVLPTSATDPTEITFQWHRAGFDADGAVNAIGAAIGDPFVVQLGDDELIESPILVMAVDSGSTVTGGYALVGAVTEELTVGVLVGAADALTFD